MRPPNPRRLLPRRLLPGHLLPARLRRRPASVVLRDQRDDDGSRSLTTARTPDGGIRIEGQDLGTGVERVFGTGLREYEWAWTVAPDAVPAAIVALGGRPGDDPIVLLAAWAQANDGADPGMHLRDAGVGVDFWSRVGD